MKLKGMEKNNSYTRTCLMFMQVLLFRLRNLIKKIYLSVSFSRLSFSLPPFFSYWSKLRSNEFANAPSDNRNVPVCIIHLTGAF